MNKYKQFIKDAYDGKYGTMCQDWKDTILKHYPEFKEEEFKVGDWVYTTMYGFVRLYDSNYHTGEFEAKNASGEYVDCFGSDFPDRKATPKEIEQHLIEEAKRRGLWDNPNVKCLYRGHINTACLEPGYIDTKDRLWSKHGVVYQKGQWAEILNTLTKEEAEKKLNCKII